MESYAPLLEKLRLPQPSLQRLAVISIFSKLRSAPNRLDSDSEPGREAITQCLLSASSAVVDQSVRELCRLVADLKMDLSRGLLELQSALEGSEPRFVGLFVKGIGLLVRLGFQRSDGSWRFASTEAHPFIKVLSYRAEVRDELVRQVVLFMVQNKQIGMEEVCEFLRPLLYYSILRVPFSDFSSALFARHLSISMALLCCSLPDDAIPILKLLIRCMKYFPQKNADDFGSLMDFAGHLVEAFIVVLRHFVAAQMLVTDIQLCGVELLETVLQLSTHPVKHSRWSEPVVELTKRLLLVQKDLGLRYTHELTSISLSLFTVLVQSELEHEQISVLKVILHLLKWKTDSGYMDGNSGCAFHEELLFIFPAISLMSSPSKSIKEAAGELIVILQKMIEKPLIVLKNDIPIKDQFQSVSVPGKIMFRLLQQLWSQDLSPSSKFFIETFAFSGTIESEGVSRVRRPWASKLIELFLTIADRKKCSLPVTPAQEVFMTEMPMRICTVASVLVTHQLQGPAAVDVLTAMGLVDPKLGIPLLLGVLFFTNMFARKDVGRGDMLLKVLGMLPSLASNSSMVPLVVQTILPLLHNNTNLVLYSAATRLLCQTWAANDRAFGSLQGILLPKNFTEFGHEKVVCLSMATSIRDICRKNPDRGVDLILSVSSCIEMQDPLIQALGFQSLAHLCEADVVDFYTAWDVIGKHMLDYSKDPNLAHSMCLLLRCGAMDAQAYPEASGHVLKMLWDIASTHGNGFKWSKARASAFDALSQYEIPDIEKIVPELRERSTCLLFSETNDEILGSMERFQVKIIAYEHMNRRRFAKERKAVTNKIEKLLDVLPQVIFSSGERSARECPGAALLCLSFTPKDSIKKGVYADAHALYENMLVEIAASLQLSRNTFVALLSLQSWKSFMRRWIRANMLSLDAKVSSVALDKPSKAAHDILKSMMRIAEESIPRSAENIVLALGALCAVLPQSAHTVISAASKFLLNWLFQFEHEHRQWSAAISLGVISSCLHVTDHKLKFQNISGLVEVLSSSKSTFVKGACGVGLGFSCQDLLTRTEAADNPDRGSYKMGEVELIGNIIRSLSLTILELTKSSSQLLRNLCECFSNDMVENGRHKSPDFLNEDCDLVEEDTWGLAGLVLGLGSSITAVYRTGEIDATLKIKDLIISWFPHAKPFIWSSDSCDEGYKMLLSVGSCLALPLVVAFCQRVELMDVGELDHLINGYRELISELLSVKKSGALHQSLLMASCAGAGSLLACVLKEGIDSIEVGCLKELLDLLRRCYSDPQPPSTCLGGMLGIVNSLGAEAGFVLIHPSSSNCSRDRLKESSHVICALLSSPVCEPLLTSSMQEIFLVAQQSDDNELQHYSAWALSFLRHSLWSKEVKVDDHVQTDTTVSEVVSQNFSNDSVVMKLCSWLTNVNSSNMNRPTSETGNTPDVRTIRTVLKCLSRAPRLPNFNWKAIVRRSMRYEVEIGNALPSDLAPQKGILRLECLNFSLAHASLFDQLLEFLDELSELSRFKTLEPNLQCCLLFRLADLVKVFSSSRREKLLSDIADFLLSLTSNQVYNLDQKILLRISCWKGLRQCLDEALLDSEEYLLGIERCMVVLFSLLPSYHPTSIAEAEHMNFNEEWSEAVRCFEKVPRDWLLNFLQVELDEENRRFIDILKKIEVKVRLVRSNSIPLAELGSLKAFLFNCNSNDTWNVLVEVVATLQHAEGSIKRQWLVDAVEISCVSTYPSTPLQFIGLLSGSCCKYMPLLILDRFSVFSDLPVTLSSLLTNPSWTVIAEHFTATLLASTERIYHWVTQPPCGEGTLTLQGIDKSENSLAPSLLQVMHDACTSLQNYLPLEKQITLANMAIH
ncbi:protein RST1 [Rhodamnia argentea]|uniref:Protein RST1 n=1 Tax=Rhodamnia argentea TaxID=178133 RepID=A0ABM3GUU3_9MYRT|nr:protein RST1 [Rhodamnia argentea]